MKATLSLLMTPESSGGGKLEPPSTTIAGRGPDPVPCMTTPALKVVLLPWLVTLTVMFVLETVPLTISGFGGLVPQTYFSACRLISSRRQRHSDLAAKRVPSSFLNGSGSLALAVSEPESGRLATVQSAPSSSTKVVPTAPA